MFKLPDYHTLHSFHTLEKKGSKFSNRGFNRRWTENFQTFKLDLENGKGARYQIANVPEKHPLLLHWLCESLWLCGSPQTRKFSTRWEYQITLPASSEACMQVKKQQLEPNMEQWAGSKSAKKYVKAVYCHPTYLTYMQSTSWEMPDWMKHKLESRLLGEISITSDMQMIPPLWQKAKRN